VDAAWLDEHAIPQTSAKRFACLEGCGFCCTYPPEVTDGDAAAIREATGLDSFDETARGTQRLPLQGGCGGCALLDERRCTACELRPEHCRLFPFHVYFSRTVEMHADRVCPGLDPDDRHGLPATEADPVDLSDALAGAVESVDVDELRSHYERALATHETFEEIARAEGAWTDPDEARRDALADLDAPSDEAFERALEPLASDETVNLPTMVLDGPDFTYRAWRVDGGEIAHLRFEEAGEVTEVGRVDSPDPPETLADPIRSVAKRLAGYECFVGAALDRVDAAGSATRVDEAVRRTVDDVVASLALREPLLQAEGLDVTRENLARAYEPAFYDLSTIGGWL
jgi:Fe-S-cluster containining protein